MELGCSKVKGGRRGDGVNPMFFFIKQKRIFLLCGFPQCPLKGSSNSDLDHGCGGRDLALVHSWLSHWHGHPTTPYWPPLYSGHPTTLLATTVLWQSNCSLLATALLYSDQLNTLYWRPLYYGQLTTTKWPPLYSGHPTSPYWSPLYSGPCKCYITVQISLFKSLHIQFLDFNPL